MAAWGYRHFDNDEAIDWLASFIEIPIALVIQGTFNDFLKLKKKKLKGKKTGRERYHNDVVAAAALLDSLTSYNTSDEVTISLRSEAEHNGLFSKAIEALREAINDPWIEHWELTNEKRKKIANLIVSLKRKARNERGRKITGKRRK